MRKKLELRYKNLSVLNKIWLVFVLYISVISGIILSVSIYNYSSLSEERRVEYARNSTINAMNSFKVAYEDILIKFIRACGTTEFMNEVQLLVDGNLTVAMQTAYFQNELQDLTNSNYLISGAMIVNRTDKTVYTLYDYTLREELNSFIGESELDSCRGITFLKQRVSPFRVGKSVIPLVIPLEVSDKNLLAISTNSEDVVVYIILLVDVELLEFSLESVAQENNEYYLITSEYEILNDLESWELEQVIEEYGIDNLVTRYQNMDISISYNQKDYMLVIGQIAKTGIYLVNYVKKETFFVMLGTAGFFNYFVLIGVIVVLLITSFFVTRYVTKPINKLIQIVGLIERNQYEEKIEFYLEDEMGQLCKAINHMHDVIQEQMRQIQGDEAEKYLMEIKLLTEQINPHFLYNTLECIQSEVLQKKNENATAMIQDLGDYLRIGLSGGADLILISEELRHVHMYIKLMNGRFGKTVIFIANLSSELEQVYILKTILQPLIENSIKHGFGIDGTGILTATPTIEVHFTIEEKRLSIRIIDNGKGFEKRHVMSAIFADQEKEENRVGMRNVYRRLCSYYGSECVTIFANSIPYYQNEIQLLVDMKEV